MDDRVLRMNSSQQPGHHSQSSHLLHEISDLHQNLCMHYMFKEVAYFFVSRLRKVFVPETNRVKLFWSDNTDQLIYLRLKRLTRCRRSDRDSNNNARGCRFLTVAIAARIVAPVAMPSSTRMIVRPCTSEAGRSPR